MTTFWEAAQGRTLVGRIETGADLVEAIEQVCAERGIGAAWVSALGAARRTSFAYYDQEAKRYREVASERHHEMSGFVGNVSDRDGRPFLHAHASFADVSGATVGGHLLRGTEVFVAEVRIVELLDVELVRRHDEETGLALW